MSTSLILAIETSCDETSVAIVRNGREIITCLINSQIPTHQLTSGVVPEVAARAHLPVIMPLIDNALTEAKTDWDQITALAVTAGPGLIGSLLIGVCTARTLAYIHDKPLHYVQHTLGHLYAPWLELAEKPTFPILTLSVSGGHNDLILTRDHGDHQIIGRSRDDAAGEAYDKIATLLGLPYPGGPSVSQAATNGDPTAYSLPRAMLDQDNFDMSFSGLKTAVKQLLPTLELNEPTTADVAASFQAAVNEALVIKTLRAAEKHCPAEIHLTGGVSANDDLCTRFSSACAEEDITFRHPVTKKYSTDNAAMIAAAAHYLQRAKTWRDFLLSPSLSIQDYLV